jgi:DNA-binding NarL/FixJ family response regulator
MTAPSVVIADDEILVSEGVASILAAAGYRVVAQTQDAMAVPELVRRHAPELVVLDIRMPPTHTLEGLDAARSIRADFPDTGILLLSAHVEIETAIDLLREGNRIGYLLKTRLFRQADLVEALRRIEGGGCVIDPQLVQELVASRHRDGPLAQLTPRENEVLALMAEGRSNSAIAKELWISEGAVEKNVRGILAKLNLPVSEESHRRVLAVLTYLGAR